MLPQLPSNAGAPQRSLFTGMLRCKACGGPFVAVNRERYGCGVHKDRGPSVCPSTLTVLRETVDKRLLAEVREQLLTPAALAELQAEVSDVLAEQLRANGDAADLARQLKAIEGEVARLVDAVASMGLSDALRQRLQAAEAERTRLKAAERIAAPSASDACSLTLSVRWSSTETLRAGCGPRCPSVSSTCLNRPRTRRDEGLRAGFSASRRFLLA